MTDILYSSQLFNKKTTIFISGTSLKYKNKYSTHVGYSGKRRNVKLRTLYSEYKVTVTNTK